MAQQVIMPKWGLTMKEGKVVRWLKGEGDPVEAGEALFEVETDKITNSVEAVGSGILARIIVPEGEVAPVQAVLAIIAAPGESTENVSTDTAPSQAADAPTSAPTSKNAASSVDDGVFVPAMPAARKLAKELGISLSTVTGSGPDGRITLKDIQETSDAGASNVNASPKALEFARKKGIDLGQVTGTGEGGRITKVDILRAMNPAAEQPAAARQETARDIIVPMEGVRKLVADNMQASLNNAAQLSVFAEVDVTELVRLRTTLLERNKRNAEYRLSINDLVSYAVCRALKRHPVMNSTLQEDGIHLHEHVNLGIAVALPNGLIVPNVKQADTYTLEELKTEIRDVAGRSRKGGLSMDEISGGTFTISNVSMLGVDGFTPILNPPETGILGVGRIVEKPAVKDGEILIRQMMTLSLTFNHMTTDGAPAMTFLRELGDMLENPGLMIVQEPSMSRKRFAIELGYAADLHGEDMTKAAVRAVRDAVSRICLCGIVEICGRDRFQGVFVHAEVAVPDPTAVDQDAVLACIPIGEASVTVTTGGKRVAGIEVPCFAPGTSDIVAACAALIVSIETNMTDAETEVSDKQACGCAAKAE